LGDGEMGRIGDEEKGRLGEIRKEYVNERNSTRIRNLTLLKIFNKFVRLVAKHNYMAGETQVWLDYALSCGYMSEIDHTRLFNEYDKIIGKLVIMMAHPEKWSI
jgi:hypothetical protein